MSKAEQYQWYAATLRHLRRTDGELPPSFELWRMVNHPGYRDLAFKVLSEFLIDKTIDQMLVSLDFPPYGLAAPPTRRDDTRQSPKPLIDLQPRPAWNDRGNTLKRRLDEEVVLRTRGAVLGAAVDETLRRHLESILDALADNPATEMSWRATHLGLSSSVENPRGISSYYIAQDYPLGHIGELTAGIAEATQTMFAVDSEMSDEDLTAATNLSFPLIEKLMKFKGPRIAVMLFNEYLFNASGLPTLLDLEMFAPGMDKQGRPCLVFSKDLEKLPTTKGFDYVTKIGYANEVLHHQTRDHLHTGCPVGHSVEIDEMMKTQIYRKLFWRVADIARVAIYPKEPKSMAAGQWRVVHGDAVPRAMVRELRELDKRTPELAA